MLIQPVLRPVLQPVLRSIFDPGIGGGAAQIWIPAGLFAASEQGGWYDPSDLATMFQDAAGTIPVTAVGQPVGRINDKSGRGNHATQSTAASRPLLQQDGSGNYYLDFDGVDDSLSTGIIDFTGTDKMTVVAGVQNSNTSIGILVEAAVSNVNTNNGAWCVYVRVAANGDYAPAHNTNGYGYSQSSPVAPLAVVTSQHDGATPFNEHTRKLRVNGVAVAMTYPISSGIGSFGTYPLYIGCRAGTLLPFNGRIYSLIVRGALTADLAPIEAFTADKTGVTLP